MSGEQPQTEGPGLGPKGKEPMEPKEQTAKERRLWLIGRLKAHAAPEVRIAKSLGIMDVLGSHNAWCNKLSRELSRVEVRDDLQRRRHIELLFAELHVPERVERVNKHFENMLEAAALYFKGKTFATGPQKGAAIEVKVAVYYLSELMQAPNWVTPLDLSVFGDKEDGTDDLDWLNAWFGDHYFPGLTPEDAMLLQAVMEDRVKQWVQDKVVKPHTLPKRKMHRLVDVRVASTASSQQEASREERPKRNRKMHDYAAMAKGVFSEEEAPKEKKAEKAGAGPSRS